MSLDKGRNSDPTQRLKQMAIDSRQRRRLQEQLNDPEVCADFKLKIIHALKVPRSMYAGSKPQTKSVSIAAS